MIHQKSQINQLHEEAMNLAETAFLKEKKEKNLPEAQELYRKAFELERQSAMLLSEDFDNEPSRSVLFQSAANLAFCAKMYREAEQMVGFALSGNPPSQIHEELRLLLRKIEINEESSKDSNAHNTAELIDQKVEKLPIQLQREAYDFIEFLLAKHLKLGN